MSYDVKTEYTRVILGNDEMSYPNEYVVRIFKGNYPRLKLNRTSFIGKSILDVSCGDGRNMVVLKQCGFRVFGTEITPTIVERVLANLRSVGIDDAQVRVGMNDHIAFPDSSFDHLLSWNACYYMQNRRSFNQYVEEFARVLKPGGYLILSIPQKTCFIFDKSCEIAPGYRLIEKDYFGCRDGEVLRAFEDEQDIRATFDSLFEDFVFGSQYDDCFGLNYHWHFVVCRKKNSV